MKLLKLLLLIFLSNQITAQCVQNEMIYNFENNINPWQSTSTYSFGQSGTSFESSKSVFVKVAFDQTNQQARAGASTNFNNTTQQWGNSQGIQFDFIFVNVANDGTAIGKPAARTSGSRMVYLELTDQSGNKIKYNFTDYNNSWHQRKALWSKFSGDSNFNKNAITSIGFYTDRNNQNYTEVFRFDDIEVFCAEVDNPGQPNQPDAILLSDVAKKFTLPKGAPNYSDVCLTSRYRRFEAHQKYKLNTEDAIDDFHPTRLDWIYVNNNEYIQDVVVPKGLKFSGTLNTQLPDNVAGTRTYNNGRCKQNGTKIKWPWLNFGDGIEQYLGSVNEPAYQSIFMDHARILYKNIDSKNLVAVQMDDPGFNYKIATDVGGCFGNGDQQKAQDLGYNINTQQNAFQKKSTELFYNEMLNQIRSESGNSNIGFSMNNDGHVFSDRVMASSFDFAMGELYNQRANPLELYNVSQQAKNLGKLQIFSPTRYVTSGSSTNYMYDKQGTNTGHTNLNRKCIATSYAIGTIHFVPWDTWLYGSTRHFGLAKNYADLFAMVRAVPHYLDGYEDAALYSPNGSLSENRYDGKLPVKVNASNNNVWAFARAKPNNAEAPVVIHLVNWANNSTNATVEIINNHISADGTFTAKLITPKTYNATAHQLANQQAAAMLKDLRGSYQSSAYQNLINIQQISTNNVNQNKTTINLTSLNTWSILVLEPSATPDCDDSDGDGVCNAEDICTNGDDNADEDNDGTPDACDNCNNNLTGKPCDDNDACTNGETYDNNCNCTGGVLQDADSDNVCDAYDICANGNDYIDDDLDGTPNACDTCPNDSTNSCETQSYCASNGNNVSFEYIDKVNVGQLNNNTGSNGGYKDFTHISENLITGTSVNVSLTPGYSGTSYPENWKIWIDFNQDGDFEDEAEELFSDAGSGTISGSITIPANAILGATVMRVTMQWSVNDSPKPCGSFTYGEVEDYTVVLVDANGKISSQTNISEDSFKVYPNPAKESIYIDLPNVISNIDNHKTVGVSIFSTDDKLIIRKEKPIDDVIKMSIEDLPNNKFYFIKISVEGDIKFSTKFLKL